MDQNKWPECLPRPRNQITRQINSISAWFEIYEVTTDTYAFLEPFHYEEVISYLIIGKDSAILFDTGMGIANIQAEVERLTNLPVSVINSHSHYDHVGGNSLFKQIFAFNNVWEIQRLKRGYTIDECRVFMRPENYKNLPPEFDLNHYQILPSKITQTLDKNEIIDLGKRKIKILHTPGETPGSICLHDLDKNILFTGDIFYPGTLWLHRDENDLSLYTQTMEKLCQMESQLQIICPGHNEVKVETGILCTVLHALNQIFHKKEKFKRNGEIQIFTFKQFDIKVSGQTLDRYFSKF
ncbi:MBL fold metallo-hydrolase [Candidatus Hodarchaeum mangrovi]